MAITLISATPSPFARMNRIALLEKGIPFELQNEIPWNEGTETPKYNPLEKLPIMLFDDGREPVYDSAHIQEYIIQKYVDKAPSLLTGNLDTDLKARQIQTLAEGTMDACVLAFFESQRGEKQSESWLARQNRKVNGGIKALDELAKGRPAGSEYLLGKEMTIADIAAACTVGHVDFAKAREGWQEQYPELAAWWMKMEAKQHFKSTAPVMFDLKGGVV